MLTIQCQISTGLKQQQEVVLVSKSNSAIAAFDTVGDAQAWLDKRSQQPGTHPTVRMVRRTVTFEELETV